MTVELTPEKTRELIATRRAAKERGELSIEGEYMLQALERSLSADLFDEANKTWQEKTEWVQKDKRFDVLIPWGKHRADVLREYIERLETFVAAAEKLVRCKGRFHSEQNYRALAALFGVTTPDIDMEQPDAALQNFRDIAHCFNDLRRFIGAKWPGVADLPSPEGVLLNGPEWKHETDAMIAALNRVADFYENDKPEQPHHNGMMHLSQQLAAAEAKLAELEKQEPHHYAVFEPEIFGEGDSWKSCHPDFDGAKAFYSRPAPAINLAEMVKKVMPAYADNNIEEFYGCSDEFCAGWNHHDAAILRNIEEVK